MIIIDYREVSLIEELTKRNIPFEIKKLEVGDIIVGDLVIERKTSQDLEASIIDGRFFDQLKKLKKYCDNAVLLVEGNIFYRLNYSCVRGALLSALFDFDIKVIQTKGIKDTCDILIHLENKQNKKNKSVKLINIKKSIDKKRIKMTMLSCLPGISYKKAKLLLEHFKTIKNFVNSVDEIDKLDGFGNKTKQKIKEILEK